MRPDDVFLPTSRLNAPRWVREDAARSSSSSSTCVQLFSSCERVCTRRDSLLESATASTLTGRRFTLASSRDAPVKCRRAPVALRLKYPLALVERIELRLINVVANIAGQVVAARHLGGFPEATVVTHAPDRSRRIVGGADPGVALLVSLTPRRPGRLEPGESTG